MIVKIHEKIKKHSDVNSKIQTKNMTLWWYKLLLNI